MELISNPCEKTLFRQNLLCQLVPGISQTKYPSRWPPGSELCAPLTWLASSTLASLAAHSELPKPKGENKKSPAYVRTYIFEEKLLLLVDNKAKARRKRCEQSRSKLHKRKSCKEAVITTKTTTSRGRI